MSGRKRRPGDDYEVGYGKPPKRTRYPKGVSGNPSGRPKKQPDFLDDAVVILGAPVTGHANGKKITLPAAQAMFRRTCQKALKGDNAALRWVIDLMLTLEPIAQQKAEQNDKAGSEARRKLMQKAGLDPDAIDDRPRTPGPRMEKFEKQADAMAKEERKRLIREAKNSQHTR